MRNFFNKLKKFFITFSITGGIVIFILAVGGATILKWSYNVWKYEGNPGGLICITGLIGSMIIAELICRRFEKN